MKASTVAALDRINRDFYRRRAFEFSDSRKRPWPGWQRVLELARQNLGPERISVLDLGCGNGRLLTVLGALLDGESVEVSYLGIDASLPLLALAGSEAVEEANGTTPRWIAGDLVRRPLAELRPSAGFDLILSFGLMHHVPSRTARRRVLAECGAHLRGGGVMAVSFWQFGDKERFRRRFVSWEEAGLGGLDLHDLEAGDHLLAWGDSSAARYCHFASPGEAAALVGELEWEPLACFRDDGGSGDLNLYHVMRKPMSES